MRIPLYILLTAAWQGFDILLVNYSSKMMAIRCPITDKKNSQILAFERFR